VPGVPTSADGLFGLATTCLGLVAGATLIAAVRHQRFKRSIAKLEPLIEEAPIAEVITALRGSALSDLARILADGPARSKKPNPLLDLGLLLLVVGCGLALPYCAYAWVSGPHPQKILTVLPSLLTWIGALLPASLLAGIVVATLGQRRHALARATGAMALARAIHETSSRTEEVEAQ